MADDRLTRQQIEDALDAISQQPEKYIRKNGKLEEAITHRVVGAGTTVHLIDAGNADLWYRNGKLNKKVNEDEHVLPNVGDRLRGATGRFWTDHNPLKAEKERTPATNNPVYLQKQKPQVGPLEIFFHQDIVDSFAKPTPIETSGRWGATEEHILIKMKQSPFDGNVGRFGKYLFGGTHAGKSYSGVTEKDKWFYDHTVRVNSPYKLKELDRLNVEMRSLWANIEPKYNFYIKSYETVLSSSTCHETSLPNLYVFFAQKAAKEKHDEDKAKSVTSPTPPNPWFKKLITLGGQIKEETSAAMALPYDERPDFRLDDPAGQYFDIWSRQYSRSKASGTISNLEKKYRNIFFPLGDMGLLNDSNKQQYLFPMYTSVEFSTDRTTKFAEVLKHSQLSSVLLSDIFEANANRSLGTEKMWQAVKETVQATSESGDTKVFTNTHYNTANRRVFDLDKWLNKFDSLLSPVGGGTGELFDGYDSDNSVFVGAYANEKKVSNDPQYSFWKSLMAVIFSGKLRKLIAEKQRSFKQIMDGELAYHETVCYRVAKFRGDVAGQGAPLQTFYFPNSNEIDVLRFVDTQVKYNEKYTYIIYAYELIVGSKYKYADAGGSPNGSSYGVRVHLEPSLKLMEVPYFRKVVQMVDNPPVHPDVEFIPYRGVNNRVKMCFNGNVGKYKRHPEVINNTDRQQLKKFHKVQDTLVGEKLEYQTDDHPYAFQIWRLDKKPKRYSDFAGNKRKTVLAGNATSATFIDKIVPNKKYYYTFRTVDVHGHISFPTPIYEYEMVDDAGSIYPLMRVVPLETTPPRSPAKSAKRYVRIAPAFDHTILDEEKVVGTPSALTMNNIPLGMGSDTESVWGKKFKIRIRSRNTGKKIDLNIRIKHKHTKNITHTNGGG